MIQLAIAAVGLIALLAFSLGVILFVAWVVLVAMSHFPLVGRRHSVPDARTSRDPLKNSLSASRDDKPLGL
jgi:hypothetical protein